MAARSLETGVIQCADNLDALPRLPAESVDLIYLDPPFFSNRFYEVIWGDEAEVRSFEDRWEGGINVYIGWMRERMVELHRVLKPTGSIYLHCDWHAGHYLKAMMDGVFGPKRFLNELVWFYKTGGASRRHWSRKHDTILLYTKGKAWTFNRVKEKSYLMHKYGFSNVTIEHDAGGDYTWVNPRDVWDIPALRGNQPEALGYPTQKPEALLAKIIAASSNEGDVVLDPFCGCGTAIAVAQKLEREWIGIDISPTAVGIMERRLEKLGAKVRAQGLPMTEADLKELRPFEFQNWVIQRVEGTHAPRKSGDMGIDGYSFMERLPIQVKQSERVGRNVVDNFETAIERAGATKGYIVAFSFTRGAREEAARVKAQKGQVIELVEVSRLIAPPKRRYPQLEDLFPELPKDFIGLPLPEPRSKAARPSVDELIRSDRTEPLPFTPRRVGGTSASARATAR
jgi:DNA modification methylase